MNFSADELTRYTRHFLLEEIGLPGQQRLKAARVLCIGAGGLGCPLLLYLAAAGVGTLGIVDDDRVELSNLQRQVLYTPQNIGAAKAEVACEKLNLLNPHSQFIPYIKRLMPENAANILQDYDIVVDCTDNFPSRYLINDTCYRLNKPWVYASIFQFEGQCSVFGANNNSACYRCLYSEPPPVGLIPNCAEAGVLGVLPGLIGTLQANEVIKLITHIGNTLAGRLLIFDALTAKMREMKLQKYKDCKLCGASAEPAALTYAVEACSSIAIEKITVNELKALKELDQVFILDVREPAEYAAYNLGGYLIPLTELAQRVNEIQTDKLIVIHCQLGPRSEKAAAILQAKGLSRIKVLAGGLIAWLNA